MEQDINTEVRIKDAARTLFYKKGYAATKTRDIAEEAGINLAMLNYYYRSKERLFQQIMEESITKIFFSIQIVLHDNSSSLAEKIDHIVSVYIDILSENPNLPVFILGEIQANPENITKRVGLSEEQIMKTALYKQLKTHVKEKGLENLNILHIPINLLSMTIFPFVAKPILNSVSGMNESDFKQFVNERKTLVPMWIKSMLKIES